MEIPLILILAVTVEALVEYGKSIGAAALGDWRQGVLKLAAVAAGVTLCLAAGADLYGVLGLGFACPWLGQALTGVLISRGANYVSDLMGRMTHNKGVG